MLPFGKQQEFLTFFDEYLETWLRHRKVTPTPQSNDRMACAFGSRWKERDTSDEGAHKKCPDQFFAAIVLGFLESTSNQGRMGQLGGHLHMCRIADCLSQRSVN
jgi:hypothetical protein